ncbi:MAG: hypothetical protein AAF447_25895, partial [Myxococcota bacterium]
MRVALLCWAAPMRAVSALVVSLALSGVLLAGAQARASDLEARYAVASEAPERQLAAGALGQARRALDGGRAGEDADARARRLGIAAAALELAERQIARARAEAALREARDLREQAAARLRAAEAAADHAEGDS